MFHRWRGSFAPFLIAGSVMAIAQPTLALDPAQPLSRYGHQTWDTETGLPQNSVHAILQTHDGFIWLGTEGGLVRFDGKDFVTYDSHNTPQLASNNIRAIVEDAGHALWVATANGLTRFSEAGWKRFTTKEGLPSNNIWTLQQDDSQRLWVVTPEGLASYDGGRFHPYPAPADYAPLMGAVTAGPNHELWLAIRNGLSIFRDGAYRPARPDNSAVDALLLDRSGQLWLGTPDGLIEVKQGELRRLHGLPGKHVTALHEDKEGTLWIGTDAGLARLRNGVIENLPSSSGDLILTIADDREGDLWVGTELGGVTILRDQKFTAYTARDGFPAGSIRCVLEDSHGVLWAGTDGQGLVRVEHGTPRSITTKDGLASNIVLSLAEGGPGEILAGTPDGLNRIKNNSISVITSADGLPDDFVRSIYRDRDNSLWIGTRRGLCHLRDRRFSTFTQADGLGSDLIGAVTRDGRNELWVATFHGLSRFEGGHFVTFGSNIITAVLAGSDGSLWIGTQDGGLNRFRVGKFHAYTNVAGLPETIYGLAEDATHHLWMSSNAGIYRAPVADLNAVVSYGTSDGLPVNECASGGHPTIATGKDGLLWFATVKGLAAVNANDAGFSAIPPLAAIESISIDEHSVAPPARLEVKPGHSRLSFEYAGLGFAAPHKLRYRYKLEGFDKDWIDAGTRTVAYYTNLPPRLYTFRVGARYAGGLWSQDASLVFHIEPHLYQELWFKLLVILACGLLAALAYWWRLKEVEARFKAVLQERNRIAREIHDTLAQALVGISVQLEVVARLLPSSVDAAREHLDQARTQVRESIGEARRAIWQLRSQSDEAAEFSARLSKLAAGISRNSGVPSTVEIHGTYRPLSPKMENELLRIAQEAMTNAIRHAEPKLIRVDVTYDDRKLRMTIADDGHGFVMAPEPAAPNGHYGLQGMRERAEQIDAKFSVNSAIGSGTVVSVEAAVN
jgi:signal transduction histidine kinase/ligand-binding sensor domain-containing protein